MKKIFFLFGIILTAFACDTFNASKKTSARYQYTQDGISEKKIPAPYSVKSTDEFNFERTVKRDSLQPDVFNVVVKITNKAKITGMAKYEDEYDQSDISVKKLKASDGVIKLEDNRVKLIFTDLPANDILFSYELKSSSPETLKCGSTFFYLKDNYKIIVRMDW